MVETNLGGGFKYSFIFHPNLGKWSKFDDHLFQMDWFNHHLEMVAHEMGWQNFCQGQSCHGEPPQWDGGQEGRAATKTAGGALQCRRRWSKKGWDSCCKRTWCAVYKLFYDVSGFIWSNLNISVFIYFKCIYIYYFFLFYIYIFIYIYI